MKRMIFAMLVLIVAMGCYLPNQGVEEVVQEVETEWVKVITIKTGDMVSEYYYHDLYIDYERGLIIIIYSGEVERVEITPESRWWKSKVEIEL